MWLADAGTSVLLSDTVGFIRDLPHKLVDAFRATLQETADADLLLHVVDAASPLAAEQIEEVERIWAAIADRDDWQPLGDKVAAIRRLGDALR